MPLSPTEAAAIARRVHPEYARWAPRWGWLLDSYVGGERYRWAEYGRDRDGLPIRNLVRHKREYPADGEPVDGAGGMSPADPTRDDYTLRLVRTPVPDLVSEVVRKHLARIYGAEVDRDGPPAYLEWAADVDGLGTDVDSWMRAEVAPLLEVYGCADVLCDHPPAPGPVATAADRARLGLGRVEARVVHPTDVPWWRIDRQGRYEEVTVRESDYVERPGGEVERVERLRHWTAESWYLIEGGRVIAEGAHPYGRPPLVRVFAARHPMFRHVGAPPSETLAERQREYYNRDSELILSDTIQAFPLLQGPEEWTEAGALTVGPGYLLPKKRVSAGTSTQYEGFEVVDFPKGGADSIRENLDRLRDAVDRSAVLARPAGAAGGSTVAQSGVSKSYDHRELSELLASKADALALAERQIGRLVLLVASDGRDADPPPDAVRVSYSHKFDLLESSAIAQGLADVQSLLADAGRLPGVEARLIYAAVADLLPGLDEGEYESIWAEIEAAVAGRAAGRPEAEGGEPEGGVPDADDDDDDDDPNPAQPEPE